MKKLLVCLLIAVGLIVAVVARWKTGSGSLTATQSATLAAYSLVSLAADHGAPVPESQWFHQGITYFLVPGAYLATRVGAMPNPPAVLALIIVTSWWIWIASARLIWCIVGRAFGVVNIADFHWWLKIVPPWRPIYRIWLRLTRWYKQFRYGKRATAEWTGMLAAMTLPFKRGDSVFLGRLWTKGFGLFQPIGISGPRHVAVVAAAGAGKTRWLMGWLGMLHKKASAFVMDTDGQIVNALGPALERAGHAIINLDPYRLSRFPGACWNALIEIDRAVKRHGREAAIRFAKTLAEALIQEDNQHQPVFANGAREFILALILYVWLFESPERRNLIRVRDLLTRGMPELVIDPKQDAFDLSLRYMEMCVDKDDGLGGKICAVIARGASVMRSGKGRDGNPFRTTAISQTAWLDLPEIEAISQHSDFAGEDLKTGNPCVFIVAPVTDIQDKLAGWVRALTMMTAYAFQNIPGKMEIPCAFCIDEMPSLGRIKMLETAAPVFRKYGIRLITITQDLERLRQAYPDSWGGFIGNSQCTIWMGSDHQETLEHLSKILGTATNIEKVDGGMLSKLPARLERREYPLMTTDQLREFLDPERMQIIVTRTGKPPIKIAYEGYDKALPVWAYDRDRNFSEPWLRALVRWAMNWLQARKPPRGSGRP